MSCFSLRQRKEKHVSGQYYRSMSVHPAKDWKVEQLLETYPHTADVFIRLGADCVGCRLDWFCTLEEVARDYSLSLEDLITLLQEAIENVRSKEHKRRRT